jgi:hypothetical protein
VRNPKGKVAPGEQIFAGIFARDKAVAQNSRHD